MVMTEERKQYLKEYRKEKLKRIPLDVSLDFYNELKEHADREKRSVNGFLKTAATYYMFHLDSWKSKTKLQFERKKDKNGEITADSIYKNIATALLDSKIDVVDVIYRLLDDTRLGAVADTKLENYRDTLKYKRTILEIWKDKNEGDYTVDDIPEWVYAEIDENRLKAVIDKMASRQSNVFYFVKIAGTVHFSLYGYKELILFLEEKKLIGKVASSRWMSEIEPKATESQ